MSDAEFKQLVKEGIDAIPEYFAKKLDNVAITIADEPTPAQRQQLKLRPEETLYGLYEGIPQTERGSGYSLVLPDKITIFKNPILESVDSPEEIRQQVRDTVWHEIAHHFGLEEHEVRRREQDRP